MSLRIGVGTSADIDDLVAASEVIRQARTSLGVPPKAALLYLSTSYDAVAVVEAVHSNLGGLPLIGCTTGGLMTGGGAHEDDAVMLVLLGGDIACTAHLAHDIARDTYARAHLLAKEAMTATPEVRMVLLHPEALGVDGGAVVRGVQDAAHGVMVAGGCAGELSGRGIPRQFFGREVLQGALPLLAIGGDFSVASGRGGGWQPVGRRYRVTKVEGRAVLELNDLPVLEVLKDYALTTGIETLVDTPFAVFDRPGSSEYCLRGVERADATRGALLFLSGIPLGAELQATLASVGDVLDGATLSAATAMREFSGGEPSGALVFSCTARKWILASRVVDEAARVAAQLAGPTGTPIQLAGLYNHGEIGPLTTDGPAFLHNQTCVTIVFGTRR